jgi:hypothetical protein
MRKLSFFAAVTLLSGCASTTIDIKGSHLKEPLCVTNAEANKIGILWGPKWRVDQKEPPLREAAALRGIEMFLDAQSCPKDTPIHRVEISDNYQFLTDAEIISMAKSHREDVRKVVFLVVRELGPKLIIGIPHLIEGGTEVVVESRVVDAKLGSAISKLNTHWQKGGPFYIKGVKSLDQDMLTTLETALKPAAEESPR